MPLPRPTCALRASRRLTSCAPCALARPSTTCLPGPSRPTLTPASAVQRFSSLLPLRAADNAHHDDHGHHDQYDPPTGWLWGIRPGEKYEKEGWESIFLWGYYGGFVLLIVGLAFKPDTSIQTWALEEARRRLEVEGILKEPDDDAHDQAE